ncbi:MAG: efflux RND transporter periplasmic adaptor subunit [Phycisphaerales bacterium]|jgi:RND family efflux transporter MFP subunit
MRSTDDHRLRVGPVSMGAPRTLALPALIAALLPLAVPACGERDRDAKPAEPPPVPVVVAAVRVADVPLYADFTGRLEAYSTVEIIARVEGELSERLVEEGQEVEAGEILFKIDDRTFAANVKQAEAALLKANADLKLAREQVQVRAAEAAVTQAKARLKRAQTDEARLRPLAEIDAVPRQDLDNAIAAVEVAQAEVDAQEATLENTKLSTEIEIARGEAAVESAQASLEQAQILLGYCTIPAPASGWIGRIDIDVGNVVGRAGMTELTTLRTIDPIYVDFAISESDYLQHAKDIAETPTPPPLELILSDGEVWDEPGRFLFAERFVDLRTGTITLRGEFPNRDDYLRPGMFARVRGEIDVLEDALLVPRRAVMQRQTSRYVYLVGEGDVVQQRTVELGADAGSDVVVVSGLAAGDRIVVEGLQKVAPGVRIVPMDRPSSAESAEPVPGGGA